MLSANSNGNQQRRVCRSATRIEKKRIWLVADGIFMSSSGCGKRKEKNNRETIEKLDPDGERKKEKKKKWTKIKKIEKRTFDWVQPSNPPIGCWDSIDYITRNAKP